MEREDFINALDAIGKIRDAIMEDCCSYRGMDSYSINTVREELQVIKDLETARKSLVNLREYLLIQ